MIEKINAGWHYYIFVLQYLMQIRKHKIIKRNKNVYIKMGSNPYIWFYIIVHT